MFFPYFSRTPQRVALLEGEKKNLERSARLVDAESKRERECAESRERTARAHIAPFIPWTLMLPIFERRVCA